MKFAILQKILSSKLGVWVLDVDLLCSFCHFTWFLHSPWMKSRSPSILLLSCLMALKVTCIKLQK
ncbi:hypothetical protein I3760_05G009500 [Carya illinoinensis]|nr:hypothetical protein I3760_05G009500 [Carya illinoinensis]